MSPHPADVISSQKQAAIRAKKGDPEKQHGQVLLANSALESTVAKERRITSIDRGNANGSK